MFQAQQLVPLVAFRAVDEPLASCMMVHFLVYIFKRHLVCKFGIVERNFLPLSCLSCCFYALSISNYFNCLILRTLSLLLLIIWCCWPIESHWNSKQFDVEYADTSSEMAELIAISLNLQQIAPKLHDLTLPATQSHNPTGLGKPKGSPQGVWLHLNKG